MQMQFNEVVSALRQYSGWILVVIFCLVPVALWLSINPIEDAFFDRYATFASLGKLFGLIGFVLYAINLVLTLRWRWVESLFNGLNRVFIAHHITGGIALAFLLFHPLFLALQYIDISMPSTVERAATSLFFQPLGLDMSAMEIQESLAYNSGILAFSGMVLLLVLTFYVKLPYQVWLATHRFLGLAFMLAGLHVVFISSDVSDSPALLIYMLFWIVLGLFAFIYRTLLGNVFVRRAQYRVERVMDLPGETVGMWLVPLGKTIDFTPGQFLFIRFLHAATQGISAEAHPFSIASEPSPYGLVLYIRSLGDFTNSLKQLQTGTIAEVEGAFGKFSYTHFRDKPQIWIAGGIGITPFISMARSFNESCPEVDLIYSVKARDELLDQAALAQYLPNRYENFRYHDFVYAETNAYLDAATIAKIVPDVKSRHIFICGPPPMMKSLRKQLREIGVKNSNIHTEEFTLS